MSATESGGSTGAPRVGLFERLRALFGLDSASAREDVEDAIEEASKDGGFSEKETAILRNVLSLHETRVADVLVPRADIIAVEINQPLGEVLAVFRSASHSRLPVYAETLDDPRGMVHILDFVDFLARSVEQRAQRPRGGEATPDASPEPVRPAASGRLDLALPLAKAGILRPVLFAPPSMPALDLLARMQASRTHMALVVDEYGGTDGLVSIEDIMETIVGDIEDEHDEAETPNIEAAADGALTMSARTPLDAVAERLGDEALGPVDRDEIDTIGGLVSAVAGRLPGRGEIIAVSPALEAEIIDVDPRRIKRVKLRRATPAEGSEAE
jgi:CBS domain containing-hemolysin-like protein